MSIHPAQFKIQKRDEKKAAVNQIINQEPVIEYAQLDSEWSTGLCQCQCGSSDCCYACLCSPCYASKLCHVLAALLEFSLNFF